MMKLSKKGFTLVEMLIVIAVIGILAVAVLSAINPVEQIRKGQDTRRRSNAAELLNAVERYYTTNEVNPPALIAGADDTCAAALGAGMVVSTELVDLNNELKAEFITRVTEVGGGNEVYVGVDASTDLTTVCYEIQAEANEALIDCPTAGTLTDAVDVHCLPE